MGVYVKHFIVMFYESGENGIKKGGCKSLPDFFYDGRFISSKLQGF